MIIIRSHLDIEKGIGLEGSGYSCHRAWWYYVRKVATLSEEARR
jgi:hypothetical protein